MSSWCWIILQYQKGTSSLESTIGLAGASLQLHPRLGGKLKPMESELGINFCMVKMVNRLIAKPKCWVKLLGDSVGLGLVYISNKVSKSRQDSSAPLSNCIYVSGTNLQSVES